MVGGRYFFLWVSKLRGGEELEAELAELHQQSLPIACSTNTPRETRPTSELEVPAAPRAIARRAGAAAAAARDALAAARRRRRGGFPVRRRGLRSRRVPRGGSHASARGARPRRPPAADAALRALYLKARGLTAAGSPPAPADLDPRECKPASTVLAAPAAATPAPCALVRLVKNALGVAGAAPPGGGAALEELHFRGAALGADGVAALATAMPPALARLDVSATAAAVSPSALVGGAAPALHSLSLSTGAPARRRAGAALNLNTGSHPTCDPSNADWFIWAAGLAALALVAGAWRAERLARFKDAAWLLLLYAANLSMLVCARSYSKFSCVLGRPVEAENVLETNQPTNQSINRPLTHYRPLPKNEFKVHPRLGGGLRGAVTAKFVAYCVWDACAHLMLFAGSAAAWEARSAAAEAEEGESADEAEVTEAAADEEAAAKARARARGGSAVARRRARADNKHGKQRSERMLQAAERRAVVYIARA
jgi:hypothetical protein